MGKFDYSQAKVLIVDDVEEVLNSTKNCLKLQGMKVECQSNPKEALSYLKNNKVDVLLLDFFMPEMNGDEFIQELRKFDNEVVVILRTGYSDKIPPLEMIDELNIQGYIDKIKGKDELLLLTKSAIKTAFLNKEVREKEKEIDAKTYQNEFLGKFLNNLMGEIRERSFAMSGNILALEEFGEEISPDNKDAYNRYLKNVKEASSKLNELIKSLEIKDKNISIKELNIILNKLFETTFYVKDIKLNIKNNTDNDYQVLQCNAKVLIYILVDIIEFLIDIREMQINILLEKEGNIVILKICNEIEDDNLINKLNKLAMLDENMVINNIYSQIAILVK